MARGWTFGRTIAAGFTAVAALCLVGGVVAVLSLNSVVASKDRVIDVDLRQLISAQQLNTISSDKSSAVRGYLLSGSSDFLNQMASSRTDFLDALAQLKQSVTAPAGQKMLVSIGQLEDAHQRAAEAAIALRGAGHVAAASKAFDDTVTPARRALSAGIGTFVDYQQKFSNGQQRAATDKANSARDELILILIGTAVLTVILGVLLTRWLRRRITVTVGGVQSSSLELQSAANQQATGARQQATAVSEITTTINELLVTSRQIAQSAQQVSQVAERTAGAGRSGEGTIASAQESMTDIRRQVDLIVQHMLELGEKSQRIGLVLDIVSELAEQTNILAINSTIEAAGAGESGKRFAVVADEIRKLADRVAESTKEIRELIELVREAVNTTVMVTEIGSKAVEAGSRQFNGVATSFEEIAALVTTTTEAAREIELSTKQQSSAVEQVNVAITSVAQATREAEASSSQTLQTAVQLTELSQELQRLVEARVGV